MSEHPLERGTDSPAERGDEAERLREALVKFGSHKRDCARQTGEEPESVACTCGFAAAFVDALSAPTPPEQPDPPEVHSLEACEITPAPNQEAERWTIKRDRDGRERVSKGPKLAIGEQVDVVRAERRPRTLEEVVRETGGDDEEVKRTVEFAQREAERCYQEQMERQAKERAERSREAEQPIPESALPFENERGWSRYIGYDGLLWVPEGEAERRLREVERRLQAADVKYAELGLALHEQGWHPGD